MDSLDVLRALAALLVVLALLGGLYWGLRRFSNLVPSADANTDLKIVAWRPFDGKRRLAIIQWDNEEHLVLIGPAGDTKIASRPAPPPPPPKEAPANDEETA